MKTKRPTQVLPIDLTGCSITKKEEDKGSIKFRLKGKTDSGVDVTGYWLTFQTVRNLYTISAFLRTKRVVEDKGTWTNEKSVSYPLKLPAKIRTCEVSTSKTLSYDDELLDGINGPPQARASETVVLFALEERRFEGRGPVPIICERAALTDKAGNVVSTDSTAATQPKAKAEPTKDSKPKKARATKEPTARQLLKSVVQLEDFAREFALSVYFGSLEDAKPMMSAGFLKANGVSGIKKATGKYWSAGKRFKHWEMLTQLGPYKNPKNPWSPKADEAWYRDFLRTTMGVSVTFGSSLLYELEEYGLPEHIPSVTVVRGLAYICTPLFERSDYDISFAIVDENDDGTLRIDAIGTFD